MKTPSDKLFQLIKSFTKNEKRYFKIFAKIHIKGSENSYIELFDVIEKQKKYDEQKIRNKIRNPRLKKRLPKEKIYLYTLLLKSLKNYHSNNDIELELQNMMITIRILYNKALYDHCLSLIKKLKMLSYQHEKHVYVTIAAKWEETIIIRGQQSLRELPANEKIYDEIFYGMAVEKNEQEYKKIMNGLFVYMRNKGRARNTTDIDEAKKMISSPLLKNSNQALSLNAKILRENTFLIYYIFTGDYKNAYLHSKIYMELSESVYKKSGNQHKYINALNNHFFACAHNGKIPECRNLIEKIKNIPAKNQQDELKIYATTTFMDLTASQVSAKTDIPVAYLKNIEKKVTQYEDLIPAGKYCGIFFCLGSIYFSMKRYRDALHSLNKIIYPKKITVRQDILSVARLLQIIIHFELENDDILPYLIKATYHWLAKSNREYKFESIVLIFFKTALPKIKNREQLLSALKALRKELLVIQKDHFEKTPLELFDFISWIESKIGNKPFEKIVKEKARIHLDIIGISNNEQSPPE